MLQIKELAQVTDPNIVVKEKTRKSPRKQSPVAASPAAQNEESPQTTRTQTASPASKKKTPPTAQKPRPNTARTFDEKEEVTKYKVRTT